MRPLGDRMSEYQDFYSSIIEAGLIYSINYVIQGRRGCQGLPGMPLALCV